MNFITSTGTSNYPVTPTVYQSWPMAKGTYSNTYTLTATATTTTWQTWALDSSNSTTSLVFNNGYQPLSAEQLAEQQRLWTKQQIYTQYQVSAEQLAEQERQRQERVRQWQEQQRQRQERQRQAEEEAKKREEEKKGAMARAKALLLSLLDPGQEKQYAEKGYFELRTDKRNYRLKPGNRVEELDPAGKVLARFCIHPPDYGMPGEDWAIAQKLMLEADEETFLRVANRSAA